MGCCVSSDAKPAAKKPRNEDQNAKLNRAPPPYNPLPEEESVKEVLSETPSVPKKPAILRARQENIDPKKIKPSLPTIPKNQDENLKSEGVFKKPIASFNSEELSEEVSEICSTCSGSVSTATYCTEKNDDDGQRSFRRRSSPLPGDLRRERAVGKSPAKRSEPSPGRVTTTGSGIGTRGSGTNGRKRDSVEVSGRRSRSPANRGDGGVAKTVMVRSGSAKKGGKSPGRVKSERSDKILKLEDFGGSIRESRENQWPPTSNESLENPLVSLECFIFL